MPLETLQSQIIAPRTEREAEIASLGPWFHNLHLPDGTRTAPDHPLGDFPAHKWREIEPHMPADLTGWTVLDIGCNAGFYTLEFARRGARVTAIDLDPHYLRQARWAAGQFNLADQIEFRQLSIYELADWDVEFDLVWFMGVLYHLRYPLLGLDIVSRKARRRLVLQSLTMPAEEGADPAPPNLPIDQRAAMQAEGWPKMAFIEHRLAGDETNWWAPNENCMEAMLRSCGMRVVGRPGHEIYMAEPAPDAASLRRRLDAEFLAATGRRQPHEP